MSRGPPAAMPLRLWLAAAAAAEGWRSAHAATASYAWLTAERSSHCKSAPTPVSKLSEAIVYPATPPDQVPNAQARDLIQSYRGDDGLQGLMRDCSMVEGGADEAACGAALTGYASGLALFAVPAACGFVSLLLWSVCCWVASCRCCRRCCLCAERKVPRPAKLWQKCAALVVLGVSTVTVFAGAIAAFGFTGDMSMGVNDMLCRMLTMADETLNGSADQPAFLGVEQGLNRVAMVQVLLDVDGTAMTDLRAILDDTASFAAALDALTMRMNHMKRVLTVVGQHKMLEHTCWFCKFAAGDNATGEAGLLNEIAASIQQSSAQAMRNIQLTAANALTGQPLGQVSSAVGQGYAALETFRRGFGGVFADGYGSYFPQIRAIEDARHTLCRFTCLFTIVFALVASNGTVVCTRRSSAKYPGSMPSLVTWCCGFLAVTSTTLFAGGFILVAVPISEICHFWAYDLQTYDGVAEYYRQIGLFDQTSPKKAMDPLAVDAWRTCYSTNGTGDLLGALQLRDKLDFQRVLHDGFIDLEDKMAGAVVDVAKFQLLVSQARTFGGLFLLDPGDTLPLDPGAAPKMIGSSLDPDDRDGPDGESVVYGLNTYAQLIAGPGRYAFQHGTAGGGKLISATQPTSQSVAGDLVVRQNALVYARYKEKLLSDPSMFRCDLMDSSFRVTEIACNYEQFKAAVTEYAAQVQDAATRLGKETKLAQQRIASDLQNSLEQLMDQAKSLRELFTCRFLRKRWEDFDLSLCSTAMPAMLSGAAAWIVVALGSVMLLVLHYKIWRHLVDNKIIGEESDHFAKKYGYLATVK